jgi:hypothetical protein
LVISASACLAWLRCSRAAASLTPAEVVALVDDVVLCVPIVDVPLVVVPVVAVPDDDVPDWVDEEPEVLVLWAWARPEGTPSATATTLAAKYRAAGRMSRLLFSLTGPLPGLAAPHIVFATAIRR